MRAITRGSVPEEQIDALDEFAERAPVEMQELLQGLVNCLREGDEIVAFDPRKSMSPREAAERLGMSRTHLYKLLDAGELPSHRVGRDRRVRLKDLVRFEEQRQASRRELAERFSSQDRTRKAAVKELADLL